MPPKEPGTTVMEHAQIEALLDEHHRILKGEQNTVGLVREVQDLKDWRLEERTTRKVLIAVASILFSLGTAAVTFAISNLKDAVLSRPVVVSPSPMGKLPQN